ncbi:MAG: CpsD/CapB family tyrosine-protein kinase [Ruminococcus sp.]|nr:CpsD/CapB family tyrosine-protein kinase [Ruminococcus sp.]
MKIKMPTQKLKEKKAAEKPKEKKNKKKDGKNVLSEKSKFAIVEAYKSARTNIMFSLSATENKAFAVTSYAKGDGKSTVAANLAISFSKMGKKVILIDCDLRRPNLHNILKLENKAGFSDMVGRMVVFDDVVHRDVLPCLDVLTSGTIPPNPSELICSPEVTRFVERLNREYDYIIFDSPPIGVVADALLLKEHIAGYLLVTRERKTTHGDIERLLQNIKLTDSKPLGFIRVGVTHEGKRGRRGYYYYYYYQYY